MHSTLTWHPHTTPHIRTARSPDAPSPAHNPTHHSDGIFTSARSPAHAVTTLHDCNVTESPTPLEFVLAASKELTACCSACASAYAPLNAARSPSCNARSPAHAHRSTDERNLPESTALHAPIHVYACPNVLGTLVAVGLFVDVALCHRATKSARRTEAEAPGDDVYVINAPMHLYLCEQWLLR